VKGTIHPKLGLFSPGLGFTVRDMGRLDVVDVTCLQCLVGRVKDNNRWAIIDRSGHLVRAVAEGGSQDS
jgi:hypothetical protein